MKRALIMKQGDSVGVCINEVKAGETVQTTVGDIIANEDISAPHKISVKDIDYDEPVYKYQHVIGYATQPIKKGDLVHVHNISPVQAGDKLGVGK